MEDAKGAGVMCTPSRVDWIMDEIKRMTRRADNNVLPAGEVARGAQYLCELWEELYQLQQTNSELAAIDPSNVAEQTNVAA
jgi:hypothetical protein